MKTPDIVHVGSRVLFGDKRFAEVIADIASLEGVCVGVVASPVDITTDRPLYEVQLRGSHRPEAKFILELIVKSFAKGLLAMWHYREE